MNPHTVTRIKRICSRSVSQRSFTQSSTGLLIIDKNMPPEPVDANAASFTGGNMAIRIEDTRDDSEVSCSSNLEIVQDLQELTAEERRLFENERAAATKRRRRSSAVFQNRRYAAKFFECKSVHFMHIMMYSFVAFESRYF